MLKKLLLFWRSTSLFNWHNRKLNQLAGLLLSELEISHQLEKQIEQLKQDSCYARVQALLQEVEYIRYEHEQTMKVLDFIDRYSMHKHPNLVKTCRRLMKNPSWDLHLKRQEEIKRNAR